MNFLKMKKRLRIVREECMYKRIISILINCFFTSIVIAIGTELYVNSWIYTNFMRKRIITVLIYQLILIFLLFLAEEYFDFLDIGKNLLKIKIEYANSSNKKHLLHVVFKTIFMYLIPVVVIIIIFLKKIPYDDVLGIKIVDNKIDIESDVIVLMNKRLVALIMNWIIISIISILIPISLRRFHILWFNKVILKNTASFLIYYIEVLFFLFVLGDMFSMLDIGKRVMKIRICDNSGGDDITVIKAILHASYKVFFTIIFPISMLFFVFKRRFPYDSLLGLTIMPK